MKQDPPSFSTFGFGIVKYAQCSHKSRSFSGKIFSQTRREVNIKTSTIFEQFVGLSRWTWVHQKFQCEDSLWDVLRLQTDHCQKYWICLSGRFPHHSPRAADQQFQLDNLRYSFEDKLSLSGLFQRVDNFLGKGLDEAINLRRENAKLEIAERETVNASLGKEYPHREELALKRENHSAVMRELQKMLDDANYVSAWTPKTSLADGQTPTTEEPQPKEESVAAASPVKQPEEQFHTLKYVSHAEIW